ncbi:MAG: Uma2 family endonuclease [Burkholderiales bacterium]|nr:Uma2 family endonuclease [Anaerolineae bacterium]
MATTTRIGMPLDEFNEAQNQQSFELIEGERIPKLPNVFGHSKTIRALFRALDSFTHTNHLGEVFAETTFIKPENFDRFWVTGSRIPDMMFYSAERFANYEANTPQAEGNPLALVPDLVVEVISPSDKYSDIDKKVDIYLQDGVRLIWLLDFELRKAAVHAASRPQPLRLTGDAVLDGEDVIPGFQIVLSSLFE